MTSPIALQENQKMDFEGLIQKVFSKEPVSWPDVVPDGFEDGFLRETQRQGIQPLLWHHLRETSGWTDWPAGIRTKLEETAKHEAVLDVRRELVFLQVVSSLQKAKIAFLLLKGSALARTHYPESYLRPRSDTDLLIREKDAVKVQEKLKDLGFCLQNMTSGSLVSHQFEMAKQDSFGFVHHMDVHWKLSNRKPFSELFSFEELYQPSRVISVQDQDVRVLRDTDALIFACMHLFAHHAHEQRLIWFYDVHLLCQQKTEAWLNRFAGRVHQKNLGSWCREALGESQRWFGPALPFDWEEIFLPEGRLSSQPNKPGQTPLAGILISDLQALSSWRDRVRLVLEHVFPPSEYLLRKYPAARSWQLPYWYLHRFIAGLPKWFSRRY